MEIINIKFENNNKAKEKFIKILIQFCNYSVRPSLGAVSENILKLDDFMRCDHSKSLKQILTEKWRHHIPAYNIDQQIIRMFDGHISSAYGLQFNGKRFLNMKLYKLINLISRYDNDKVRITMIYDHLW